MLASYLCLATEIVIGWPLARIAGQSTSAAAASWSGNSSASSVMEDSNRASFWSVLWRSSMLPLYPVLDRCNKFGLLALLVTCVDGVVAGGGSLEDDGEDVQSKSIFRSGAISVSRSSRLYSLGSRNRADMNPLLQ